MVTRYERLTLLRIAAQRRGHGEHVWFGKLPRTAQNIVPFAHNVSPGTMQNARWWNDNWAELRESLAWDGR